MWSNYLQQQVKRQQRQPRLTGHSITKHYNIKSDRQTFVFKLSTAYIFCRVWPLSYYFPFPYTNILACEDFLLLVLFSMLKCLNKLESEIVANRL